MVRASLPLRGAAVVLLCASAAAGQTSLPTADFSDEILDSVPSRIIWQTSFGQSLPYSADFSTPYPSFALPVMWQYEVEGSPTLETSMGDIPVSSDNLTAFALPDAKDAKDGKDGKDASRLKPTPSPSSSAQQPPSSSAPLEGEPLEWMDDGSSCPFVADGEFPCADMLLPFACPPPSRHKCRRRHRHEDNPYLGWPCAMTGYPGFCAPPPSHGHHKGLFRHRCRDNEDGYGYGYRAGPWAMGCGGFMGPACPGFYCPPPTPACSCRKCQRKHAHHHGGGYAGPYGGYGAFDDPNCYLGVWSPMHRCGLFHRCHARRHAPPPCPYPYYGCAMQPCMGMGMGMGMSMGMDFDMGMDMGFCPSCSAGAAMP